MNRSSILTNFPGFAPARMPQDVTVFYDDFQGASWSDTDHAARWLYTAVAGGAALASLDMTDATPDELGGVLSITTVATADDGANLQVTGESFITTQDEKLPLYFEARLQVQDVSNCDALIGLSATDTEIITTNPVDFIGYKLESGTLYAETAEDSTEELTDCSITETDSDWIRVAFYFDGDDTITFYVDDDDDGDFDYVASRTLSTSTDDVPEDVGLTPTIEVITGTTASAEVALFDYVFCAQQRYNSTLA